MNEAGTLNPGSVPSWVLVEGPAGLFFADDVPGSVLSAGTLRFSSSLLDLIFAATSFTA